MHTSANAALSCDFVPSSEVLAPPDSSSSSQLAALASPVVKAMASAKLPCNGSWRSWRRLASQGVLDLGLRLVEGSEGLGLRV